MINKKEHIMYNGSGLNGKAFVERLTKVTGAKTQKDVAKRVGITEVYLSRAKNGNWNPTANTLLRIAEEYGCSVDYLLGLDGGQTDIIYGQEESESDIMSKIAMLVEALEGIEQDNSTVRELVWEQIAVRAREMYLDYKNKGGTRHVKD